MVTPAVPQERAEVAMPGDNRLGTRQLAALVALAVVLAYLPVLTTSFAGTVAGWVAVLVIGAVFYRVRAFDLEVLTCAICPTSALTLSGFVQSPSQYMALAAVAGALVLRVGWTGRHQLVATFLPRAQRPLQLLLAAYLGWAAVTTALSTNHRLSLVYLAGMLFAIVIAFAVVPQALPTRASRRRFLGAIVATGFAAVSVSVLLAVIGPTTLYGVPFGSVLVIEPTVLQHQTHIVYARAFGPYVDQGPYYTLLAVGILAALALREESRGAWRLLFALAAIVLGIFELGSFARAGWLMIAAGACVWVFGRFVLGRRDWFGGAVAAVFILALGALLVNSVGAVSRFDIQAQRGWPAYIYAGKLAHGFGDVKNGQIKGGSSLTEREYLWGASISAIKVHPITGYGPGTDALAIAPFMANAYTIYRGVSSHSGWLRTGVEMGVPGMLLDAALWTAILLAALFRLIRRRETYAEAALVTLVAMIVAFLTDQFFEVYLFGGLGFPNLVAAIAIGLVAAALAAPAQPAAAAIPGPGASVDDDGNGSRATTMIPSPQKGVVR